MFLMFYLISSTQLNEVKLLSFHSERTDSQEKNKGSHSRELTSSRRVHGTMRVEVLSTQ